MKTVYLYFCIVIAALSGCVTPNPSLGDSGLKTQLLADLFRSIGNTYKVSKYGFDMPDADFVDLQSNFNNVPPVFDYQLEKRPIGQETVISVESVTIHVPTAQVTLFFSARDAFYTIQYTLHGNSGGWKIVGKKILSAS